MISYLSVDINFQGGVRKRADLAELVGHAVLHLELRLPLQRVHLLHPRLYTEILETVSLSTRF